MTPDAFAALSDLVDSAAPEALLPVRAGRSGPPAPLRLVDAWPLRPGHYVLVLAAADDTTMAVPAAVSASDVRRAAPGDGTSAALVAALLGRPDGSADGRFTVRHWRGDVLAGERAITVDQTNESVVVGDRAVVKWQRRLAASGSPAARRIGLLADAGFSGMPDPWALLTWQPPGPGRPVLVASVTELLPQAQDGWDWAVGDVRGFARGDHSLDDALQPASTLGALVGDLHVALAADGRAAAGAADCRRWVAGAEADLSAALRLTGASASTVLPPAAERIRLELASLAEAVGTPLIEIHGDLHVGQVLRSGRRYAVTDFDGNPVIDTVTRDERQPVALDVAGMLQSLDHVGRIVVRRTDGIDPAAVTRWIDAAQSAFLAAYVERLAGAGTADLLDRRLLRPYRLQQECRELLYADRFLPRWHYVPEAALAALLDPTTEA